MDGELSLKMGGATNPCAPSAPRSFCCRCYYTRDIPFRALGFRLFLFSFFCCCCWSTRRYVTKATARSTRVCVCAFRRWRRCVRAICPRGRCSMVCVCVEHRVSSIPFHPSFGQRLCVLWTKRHTLHPSALCWLYLSLLRRRSHETSFSFEVTVQTFRRAFSFTCVAIEKKQVETKIEFLFPPEICFVARLFCVRRNRKIQTPKNCVSKHSAYTVLSSVRIKQFLFPFHFGFVRILL